MSTVCRKTSEKRRESCFSHIAILSLSLFAFLLFSHLIAQSKLELCVGWWEPHLSLARYQDSRTPELHRKSLARKGKKLYTFRPKKSLSNLDVKVYRESLGDLMPIWRHRETFARATTCKNLPASARTISMLAESTRFLQSFFSKKK